MKEKGKKLVCTVLAAVFLLGNPVKHSFAEEAVQTQETYGKEWGEAEGEEIISGEDLAGETSEDAAGVAEASKGAVGVTEVSEGAIGAAEVSGTAVRVSALSAKIITADEKTTGKKLKLNLSYHILGCVKVDSKLNVRKKPGTEEEIVGYLKNNTFCDVLEVYENGWAKIKSGKVSGYISTDYLLMGEKAEAAALKKAKKYAIVKTSNLNIRALPTVDAGTYGKFGKHAEADLKLETVTKADVRKLLKRNKSLRRQINRKERKKMLKASNLKDWVCISYRGKRAFLSKDYVKISYVVKTGNTEAGEKSSLRAKIVKYAKKFLGNRYVYGGSSLKHGTDCSGFVMRIYQHFGYHLSRSSSAQSRNGKAISRSRLQPGDLLFYKKHGRISHVTMYIGNGKVIHASNEKNGIMISRIGYRKACKYVKIIKT